MSLKRGGAILSSLLLACSAYSSDVSSKILNVNSTDSEIKFSFPSIKEESVTLNSDIRIPVKKGKKEGLVDRTKIQTGLVHSSVAGFNIGSSVGVQFANKNSKEDRKIASEGYVNSWLSKEIYINPFLSLKLDLYHSRSLLNNEDNLGVNISKGIPLTKNLFLWTGLYHFSNLQDYFYQGAHTALSFKLDESNLSIFMDKFRDNYQNDQYFGIKLERKF